MEISRKSSSLWALPILLLCFFVVVFNNGVLLVDASHKVYMHLQSTSPVDVKNVHRTGYHFQPSKNWINDPNGPMYYNGFYHLFYQHNPKAATWDSGIVWAHSVSTDLINWIPLEPAIYPSKVFDKNGTWSGSATILPGNKPIILYTGIVDANSTQVQNYAIPAKLSDPYLRKWIKPDNNPLIVADMSINKTQFRDPTTAWMGRDGHWRILIGSVWNHRGKVIMYRSRDFMKWTKAKHPFHTATNTGNWECPDFFPVSMEHTDGLDTSYDGENIKHVLKVSLDFTRFEYYTIGTYDTKKDRYIPDNTSIDGWKGLRLDYGNYYASKTFYDSGKNRRVLMGWANESDTENDDERKGWAGVHPIPANYGLILVESNWFNGLLKN